MRGLNQTLVPAIVRGLIGIADLAPMPSVVSRNRKDSPPSGPAPNSSEE
jgi:hypothetical protein